MNPTNEHERLRSALRKASRFSHAKDFSHHGVSFEDCDKEPCVEARANLQPTTSAQALSDGWVYEDTLPESTTQQQYDWWYERSLVVEGVRMGPPLTRYRHCDCHAATSENKRDIETLVAAHNEAMDARDTEVREVLEELRSNCHDMGDVGVRL